MERRTELSHYTAVDREFFETYGRRDIDETDFVDAVRRVVPAAWSLHRSGVWMHVAPPHADLPVQGWKIHISSIGATARIVLSIAAAMLVSTDTAFKFAADARLLSAVNGKRWPRGGSGKFITVYPRDLADFRRIIDDLHAALSGYIGPYVLSDRRYLDSRVLYYRYGGIMSDFRILAGGQRELLLRRPDGDVQRDDRHPRFRLPAWVRDPFAEASVDNGTTTMQLASGRFHIQRALRFSAAGGIYIADDLHEGRRVLVKEARPFIGEAEPATTALRKEFRLLRRLAPLGVAPSPVAYFQEWEHHYLVEEFITGTTLRQWLAARYPWLKSRATRAEVGTYLRAVCTVFSRIAEALDAVHASGVSLGDLSFHNCMVRPDGSVCLIDLEAAAEDGLDLPGDIRTPGFSSPGRRVAGHADAVAEDVFAFGANLLAAMMPMNAMLPLDPGAAGRVVRRMCEDMGYPTVFAVTIDALLSPHPASRPSPVAAMAGLRAALPALPEDGAPVPHRTVEAADSPDHTAALFGYIEARAQEARPDRYVPGHPDVFETHPFGVAHGAAGLLHAFQRAGRPLPANLPGYLLRGITGKRDRGADLMHGDAGIAWVLLDAGHVDEATGLLARSDLSGPIAQRPGLHDGLAGWGLTRIKAWHETANATYLVRAVDAGTELLSQGVSEAHTLRWPTPGEQPIGLGHGAAGIALFLLHLYIATGQSRFLSAATAGLDYDLGQSTRNPDGDPTWPTRADGVSLMPYRRHGTAGILAVVARFFACTGEARYRDVVLASEADLMRRHAISPGLFDGLAGLGETLLDLATFLPDRAGFYLREARRVASGIEPFLIRRDSGLAVPGTELLRLSCDLATGSAGVAMFFHRLAQGGRASFMLDEHLTTMAAAHITEGAS